MRSCEFCSVVEGLLGRTEVFVRSTAGGIFLEDSRMRQTMIITVHAVHAGTHEVVSNDWEGARSSRVNLEEVFPRSAKRIVCPVHGQCRASAT